MSFGPFPYSFLHNVPSVEAPSLPVFSRVAGCFHDTLGATLPKETLILKTDPASFSPFF